MAAITIAEGDVLPASSSGVYEASAGANMDAGTFIYLDANDSNKAKKAVANSTEAAARVVGITVNSALVDQPVSYLPIGNIPVGGVFGAKGLVYVLSATAGKMCLPADLSSGHWLTIIGYSYTTSILKLGIVATGIQQ